MFLGKKIIRHQKNIMICSHPVHHFTADLNHPKNISLNNDT